MIFLTKELSLLWATLICPTRNKIINKTFKILIKPEKIEEIFVKTYNRTISVFQTPKV